VTTDITRKKISDDKSASRKIFEKASRILTVVAKISYYNLASLDKN